MAPHFSGSTGSLWTWLVSPMHLLWQSSVCSPQASRAPSFPCWSTSSPQRARDHFTALSMRAPESDLHRDMRQPIIAHPYLTHNLLSPCNVSYFIADSESRRKLSPFHPFWQICVTYFIKSIFLQSNVHMMTLTLGRHVALSSFGRIHSFVPPRLCCLRLMMQKVLVGSSRCHGNCLGFQTQLGLCSQLPPPPPRHVIKPLRHL